MAPGIRSTGEPPVIGNGRGKKWEPAADRAQPRVPTGIAEGSEAHRQTHGARECTHEPHQLAHARQVRTRPDRQAGCRVASRHCPG